MPEQEYLTVDHLSTEELTRIFSKVRVNPVTQCWEAQSNFSKEGYGKILFHGRIEFLHRLIYAWAVERLPRRVKGQRTLQLDHTVCKNEPCCNPAHLELVSPRVNSLRSSSPVAAHAKQAFCLRGHVLPAQRNGRNERVCLPCRRYLYKYRYSLTQKKDLIASRP